MTTPLSWASSTFLQYGADEEHIGFDWSSHKINIGYKTTSGSTTTEHDIVALGSVIDGLGLYVQDKDNQYQKIDLYTGGGGGALNISTTQYSGISFTSSQTAVGAMMTIKNPNKDEMSFLAEMNGTATGVWLVLQKANQVDEDSPAQTTFCEINNEGIHLPVTWKTAATDSIRVSNIDFNIETYDAEFLSIPDDSVVMEDPMNRNSKLTRTVPSTYAVRMALAELIPAPFSFVTKTDANGNDYFGIKFTDPQDSTKTKTAWFNFATVDGYVSAFEWENADTRKTVTP